MSHRTCFGLSAGLILLPLALVSANLQADQMIYDDALQGGFQNWSWQSGGDAQPDVDLANDGSFS